MCSQSVIMGDFNDRHGWTWPINPVNPFPAPSGPSQVEFDKLAAEVKALKKLLKAAQAFDEATGQKDCEQDEKVELLRRIAEHVGVDVSDLFPA